jgi:hypothetical protein
MWGNVKNRNSKQLIVIKISLQKSSLYSKKFHVIKSLCGGSEILTAETARNIIFWAVMPHISKEVLEHWQTSTKLYSIVTQKIVLFFNMTSTYHRESSVLEMEHNT